MTDLNHLMRIASDYTVDFKGAEYSPVTDWFQKEYPLSDSIERLRSWVSVSRTPFCGSAKRSDPLFKVEIIREFYTALKKRNPFLYDGTPDLNELLLTADPLLDERIADSLHMLRKAYKAHKLVGDTPTISYSQEDHQRYYQAILAWYYLYAVAVLQTEVEEDTKEIGSNLYDISMIAYRSYRDPWLNAGSVIPPDLLSQVQKWMGEIRTK